MSQLARNPKFTNEMNDEIIEVFMTLSENHKQEYFPAARLLVGLKALGFDPPNELAIIRANNTENVDFKEFCRVIISNLENLNWCLDGIKESFNLFDKDGGGLLDAGELRRVFNKMGEILTDAEIEDQMKEVDINANGQMDLTEWCNLILAVEGTDYMFEDS